ncbi:GntR family transcriptional regulator [Roseibium sp.]|uniref:GntR family transcriptional regulator n=1 Tax=Roseibium sp. TaxID=1936156 RepID=UPI003A974BFD
MLKTPESGSVGDKVLRRIKNDIIFGLLKPGQKLRLEALRQQYGVSVTTLREILNGLAAIGFVHAEGQKGFEVAPVSVSDLKEIADLRLLLETHALKLSFAHGDIDWEAGVVGAHYKLRAAETRRLTGDKTIQEDWKRADWEFHRALIQACGSATLLETHATIFGKFLRYQMQTDAIRGKAAAEEHLALLEAAKTRDFETADKLLRQHIMAGVEHNLSTMGS